MVCVSKQTSMPNYTPKKQYLQKQKTRWNHLPTTQYRYPAQFKEQMDAIAHWADNQENPEEALAAILEFINNK